MHVLSGIDADLVSPDGRPAQLHPLHLRSLTPRGARGATRAACLCWQQRGGEQRAHREHVPRCLRVLLLMGLRAAAAKPRRGPAVASAEGHAAVA